MDEKNETGSAAPEMPGKQPPLRRVGSFTLGVCLIAAGIFFLLTSFLPLGRGTGNTISGRC